MLAARHMSNNTKFIIISAFAAAILGLVGSSNDSAMFLKSGSAVPGNRRLVFYDDFTSINTIDMTDTRAPGFKWYRNQWWGNGVTNTDSISISDSVLKLGGGTGRGRLQSGIANGTSYVGNAWRNGGYFEVRLRFDPQQVGSLSGNFGIYLFSVEHIYDDAAVGDAHWPGQAPGYGHFIELDIFELAGVSFDKTYNGKTTFQGTIHDWSGTYDVHKGWQNNIVNSNSLQKVGAVDWSQYHTYGVLWVPQNGSDPGFCQWFFDDVPLNATHWRGPVGSPPLPGRGSAYAGLTVDQSTSDRADRVFSVVDRQSLVMQLDGNSDLPMDIDWVRVWQ